MENNEIPLKKDLQKNTKNIRNICVIAHVDHGKTSIVDNLISYNNIINPRLAGLIRYMDNLPEEQERCITMKTSSISLVYKSPKDKENYLINVIDSPGHVDFSSEILTAVKVCEGGLLVIDVVEGVCSQTISVIKQAFVENIKLILVFNKIDRLISEIQFTSLEAYEHINLLLQKINSITSSLIDAEANLLKEINNDLANEFIEIKEEECYFSPEKGNVIFSSAYDGWAFNLDSFAKMLSGKLSLPSDYLKEKLWGNFYYNKSTKDIDDEPPYEDSKPTFVQFVLDSIYKIYEIILSSKDKDKIVQIANAYKINIPNSDFSQLSKDPKNLLRTFMRQLFPVASCIFEVVIDRLPNPLYSFKTQICRYFEGFSEDINVIFSKNFQGNKSVKSKNNNREKIVESDKHSYKSTEKTNTDNSKTVNEVIINSSKKTNTNQSGVNEDGDNSVIDIFKDIFGFEKEKIDKINSLHDTSALAHILKMITIPAKNCPSLAKENTKGYITIPFARCFSGIIKKNKDYYLIGPKTVDNCFGTFRKITFNNLFTFMGQYLEEVDEVYPGCLFSILGIQNSVFKTALLVESPMFPVSNFQYNFCPLIKASITVDNIKDLPLLTSELNQLNNADPAVNYYVQNSGEHILETLGEVHLERIHSELSERLKDCKIIISPPIIEFREGLANTKYKKDKIKKKKKNTNYEKIDKNEGKNDPNNYELNSSAEEDIDKFKYEDKKNSSMPIMEKTQLKVRFRNFKPKNIVLDYKSKKEKLDFYLEKCLHLKNENKDGIGSIIEISTNNKYCYFGFKMFSLNNEQLDFLDSNHKLIETLMEKKEKYPKDIMIKARNFKKDFLNLFDSKLAELILKRTFSICNKNYKNILCIKDMNMKYSFFNKKVFHDEIDHCIDYNYLNPNEELGNKFDKNVNLNNTGEIDSEENNKIFKINLNQIDEVEIDDYINEGLKDNITLMEFYNSIKLGYEMATGKLILSFRKWTFV